MIIVFLALGTLSFSVGSQSIMAETNIKEKCGYNGEPGVNPDFQTINCLLTEKALEYKVPPEIVKAIAANESGAGSISITMGMLL